MTLTRTLTTAGAKPSRIRQDRRPMTLKRFLRKYLLGVIAILASIVVFIVVTAIVVPVSYFLNRREVER